MSDLSFQNEYTKAIATVLDHPAVKDKDDFRVFVLNYTQLFKANDIVTDDECDQISWTAWCSDCASGDPDDWLWYSHFQNSYRMPRPGDLLAFTTKQFRYLNVDAFLI